MKNKKLNLNELRVKSFVTTTTKSEIHTIKGGFLSLFNCKTDDDNCAPYTQACDTPSTGGSGSGNPLICPDHSENDCSLQHCN